MRCHAGERVLLEPLTGVEQPRRDAAGRRRRLARGKPLPASPWEGRACRPRSGSRPGARATPRSAREPRARERTLPDDRRPARSRAARGSRDSVSARPSRCIEALGKIGGIETRGQRDDADVKALRRRELHAAQCRRLARRVAVETEPHTIRQTAELLQLTLGQCRPHRRNDGLDARLTQREHVRVPLDDHGALLLRDRSPRAVESVEQVALAKELSLGRVDVLGLQRIVLAQLARLEAEHTPTCIGEREEQAPEEVVVAAPIDRGLQRAARRG